VVKAADFHPVHRILLYMSNGWNQAGDLAKVLLCSGKEGLQQIKIIVIICSAKEKNVV